MTTKYAYDAIVIGSGPNGLAASIVLARAGHSVLVVEAKDTIGGGARSKELTLPGFMHDICSAVHPLGIGSPFFRTLPLEQFGLSWLQPDVPLAHPVDNGMVVLLQRSISATAQTLGEDADAYEALMHPIIANWDYIAQAFLGPLRDTTPAPDIFICSSSTPPGGGVHGMCGYFAAVTAMKRRF